MKEFITALAIVLIVAVFAAFVRDASAATVETLTIEFDSVPISEKGAYTDGCLVQRDGTAVVIVGPCADVAAWMREQMQREQPLLAVDFIVDGEAWGRI